MLYTIVQKYTLMRVRAANLDTLDSVLRAKSVVSMSNWWDSKVARNLSWNTTQYSY